MIQNTPEFTPKRAMNTQQQSPLFSKLPPELRNRIYGLVLESEPANIDFTMILNRNFSSRDFCCSDPYHTRPHESQRLPLALEEFAPPSSALMRSCQKTYNEAVGMFNTYWYKDFIITLQLAREPDVDFLFEMLSRLPGRYISRIRNFTFLLQGQALSIFMTLKWSGQGWDLKLSKQSSLRDEDLLTLIDQVCKELLMTLHLHLGRHNLEIPFDYLTLMDACEFMFRLRADLKRAGIPTE